MVKKRLSKALAAAGIASRRASEKIIQDGRVSVNGKIVLIPQTLVDFEKDTVIFDNRRLKSEEKKVYYMLHKPVGFICTSAPGRAKRVIDIFSENPERLYTVGRLDRDTSGLLIVTNDGHFANKITHPSNNVQKEYIVKADKEILHDHLVKISKGTMVDGHFVTPIAVRKVRKSTLKVIVGDGRRREVRQLVERAGLEVLELKRVRIGDLILGKLPLGTFRPLTEREKELLIQPSSKIKNRKRPHKTSSLRETDDKL